MTFKVSANVHNVTTADVVKAAGKAFWFGYTHAHTCAHAHAYMHAYTCTHAHTCVHTHMHTVRHMHTHPHTHAHPHTHRPTAQVGGGKDSPPGTPELVGRQ